MNSMPNIATTNDIQRSYRKVFDKAKKKGPVVIMTNNKPDVVILSPKDFDRWYMTREEWEMKEALEAVRIYKKEKREGKLKELKSLANIL